MPKHDPMSTEHADLRIEMPVTFVTDDAAANKLESAWGDLSSADCDLLNEGYPFVGSFDEVCNDLSAWRRGLDEKIAKLTAQESES
jgi:hypothetical protein